MADSHPHIAQSRPEPEAIDEDGTVVDTTAIAVLNRSEIEQQIATAHKFPRSVRAFIQESLAMVTLNERVAEECFYALPRDGRTVEGPSARLAEIIANAWGNCRAGARVVAEDGEFITAQGVFHDLQKNAAIAIDVKRRIVDKKGRRFSADMIAVTGNAASSIALRNAILRGVPKAFWSDTYEAARRVAVGDIQTLANRRAATIAAFQKYGVRPEQIFLLLNVKGDEDITLEHLATLKGIGTALKEGDTTPEEAFPPMPMAAARTEETKEGQRESAPTEQKGAPKAGSGKGRAATAKADPEAPAAEPEQTGPAVEANADPSPEPPPPVDEHGSDTPAIPPQSAPEDAGKTGSWDW